MQTGPGCARSVVLTAGLVDQEQGDPRSGPHCSAQSQPGERSYSELLRERMRGESG